MAHLALHSNYSKFRSELQFLLGQNSYALSLNRNDVFYVNYEATHLDALPRWSIVGTDVVPSSNPSKVVRCITRIDKTGDLHDNPKIIDMFKRGAKLAGMSVTFNVDGADEIDAFKNTLSTYKQVYKRAVVSTGKPQMFVAYKTAEPTLSSRTPTTRELANDNTIAIINAHLSELVAKNAGVLNAGVDDRIQLELSRVREGGKVYFKAELKLVKDLTSTTDENPEQKMVEFAAVSASSAVPDKNVNKSNRGLFSRLSKSDNVADTFNSNEAVELMKEAVTNAFTVMSADLDLTIKGELSLHIESERDLRLDVGQTTSSKPEVVEPTNNATEEIEDSEEPYHSLTGDDVGTGDDTM